MKIPDFKNIKPAFLHGRRLNKKRLSVIASVIVVLIAALFFLGKMEIMSFAVKEDAPACADECSFEDKLCENARIFECLLGEDGCKHKVLLEECPAGAECSAMNNGKCYTPNLCDGDFHMCISDVLYKMCKNGKTVEGTDTKRCPDGLMCNRNPKQFSICVEKDY